MRRSARNRIGSAIAAGLALVLVAAAVGCSDDEPTVDPPTTLAEEIELVDLRGKASGGNYPEVGIRVVDNEFVDGAVRIDPGVTVSWTNDGRVDHNIVVTGDGPAFGVEASSFAAGQEHEFRFTEPGVYPYFCSLHGSAAGGMTGAVVVGDVPATQRGSRAVPDGPPKTITVPDDEPSIQAAVDSVPPGSLVLVEPGTYQEEVVITTDRLVLRGLDRDETVLDGGGTLNNGVLVLADGVAVENLTARDYQVNGFMWHGVTGFRGSYLTALDNRFYGIYAFDSIHGVFEHSYAAGSTDSGFYVGQCDPCETLVTDVVAEGNQLGFSGVNVSDGLSVVESTWRGNRAGIVLASFDNELLAPQHGAVVAGNLVDGAGAADGPQKVEGSLDLDLLFGIGIAVIGGLDDVVVANRVFDWPRAGIALAPNPQLQENFWPAQRNRVEGNEVSGSGMFDLGLVALPDAGANCFVGNRFASSAPIDLEEALPCDRVGTGDVTTGAVDLASYLQLVAPTPAPRGPSRPPPQPEMPRASSAPAEPATDVDVEIDIDRISVPRS
ncbi:MAG: plastocyanin/azurin family copper-binding protein [Acidimicrobiales bacterium]